MGVEFVPFAGRPVRSLTCSVFQFTESIYRAGFRIPKHAHAEPYIGITVEGGWTQELEDRCLQGSPWTVTLHPAGEIHSNRFYDSDARIVNIKITSGQLRQLLGGSLSVHRSVSVNEGKAGWIAREIYRGLGHRGTVSAVSLNGLTLQLLAELLASCDAQASGMIPEWLVRAKEVVEARFAEPLRLEAVAAQVGVHPVHLAREFRRRFNATVGDRIRDLRIARACQLLTESGLPLVQVALEVGYSDQASFTTTFRRRTGLTPLGFRRLNRSC